MKSQLAGTRAAARVFNNSRAGKPACTSVQSQTSTGKIKGHKTCAQAPCGDWESARRA